MNIQKKLFENQDLKYKKFQEKLIPNISCEKIIGVRTPILRNISKEIYKKGELKEYIKVRQHDYFEENQIHIFLISLIKDFDDAILETRRFLPYIDNWATCDQLNPKIFSKHKDELKKHIDIWLHSSEPYTIRFAINMLRTYFLKNNFDLDTFYKVVEIKSEDYYVNMAIAWYIATAMIYHWTEVSEFLKINLIKQNTGKFVHNKSIQKAVESYRITDEQKEYLKTLKMTKEVK